MSENLENLATDFFKRFACSEFALKDGNFYNKDKKAAEADWREFASSIENTLSEQELNKPEAARLKEAVEFLLNAPPKKQYIGGNGSLVWRGSNPKFVIGIGSPDEERCVCFRKNNRALPIWPLYKLRKAQSYRLRRELGIH